MIIPLDKGYKTGDKKGDKKGHKKGIKEPNEYELSDRILDTKMTKKRGLRIAFRVRVFFYYRSFSIRMQRNVSP